MRNSECARLGSAPSDAPVTLQEEPDVRIAFDADIEFNGHDIKTVPLSADLPWPARWAATLPRASSSTGACAS